MINSTNKPRNSLVGILTTALTAAAPALGVVAMAMPTDARAADSVACNVHAIHLTKEGDGKVPKELAFLEAELRDDQFAAYKGFRLLDRKQLQLTKETPGKASFKSGHRVELKLLDAQDKRLRLHATLIGRGGDKPLVSTAYGIDNGGVFMMGGSSYEGGKLLFAIRCASKG